MIFLKKNYVYLLLEELINRKQKKNYLVFKKLFSFYFEWYTLCKLQKIKNISCYLFIISKKKFNFLIVIYIYIYIVWNTF